ncbi:MAG: hypothetical protein ACD_44C00184G0003 [uncultured bacterium]|nr:MAG: hypothetical protein ACD_44C00184G0003 [uncultured bacterium]OGT16413.1 MAG: hypothetical protein A3B69_05450 [Gammaproteobacteria bacterium RIFCSPHIGHO2_02_FULL_38_33]OGT24553.1 MAG: hypothetical protein A2W47_02210 [Gammaproteobacteria bacterium RIFCSPHIGHO2_12_38_15]OGT67628.1 MAG: hypothetical protein A3I12_01345 [Gammaproteobacteria bacterium RIFCSPLOWO2_02_FULL_38_11]OGT75649.1 MAG: hypothetical protein A3G71_00195 [Gammaproteobacteria bacterium RIFCSPLOWO2_12_FULL_38_14]
MNLDKRQKIILFILIVLIIFLIWQIKSLFHKPTAQAEPALSNTKTKIIEKTGATTPMPSPSALSANENSTSILSPMTSSTTATPQLLPPQQIEYLQTIDEYQLAQAKRMLAEQITAIAIANQNTAKAKAETTRILTEVTYGNNPFPNLQQQQAINTNANSIALTQTSFSQQPTNNAPTNYKVVFIGSKEGKWSAILAKNGEYTIVTPGMIMPDQSTVSDITPNNVTLQLPGGAKMTLPIQSSLNG